MSEPWGHKWTVHVYIQGRPEDADQAIMEWIESLTVPGLDFVGMDLRIIDEEPQEQMGT